VIKGPMKLDAKDDDEEGENDGLNDDNYKKLD